CFARFKVKACLVTPGLGKPVAPTGTLTGWNEDTCELRVEQISPDKDVNFRYATAAFTISPEPWASLCCANLPGNLALYAVSVRRLIALHSGFLQTLPHGNALAFG
ncbi:MAG: hypothetical protein U9R24_00785, partial [Thermodesulfobacteriota bacterium]|nr:hypothetical protein [Thermodesulfobacteriota bacterium]